METIQSVEDKFESATPSINDWERALRHSTQLSSLMILLFEDGVTALANKHQWDDNIPDGSCPDCGVKSGEYHDTHCDWDRCPRCKMQLLGCDCISIGHVLIEKR